MKLNRLRRLFHKSRAEHELDKELRFHIEQQVAANLEAGMSSQEARRRARLEFGGLDRVKDEVRDTRWETHVGDLIRDFRYALRNLRKDRRFTLAAIFALTLGIGASTIVFSFVYNVFFHALSYKDFNRSVVFKMQNRGNVGGWKDRAYFSPEEVRVFREQNHVLEDIIAHAGERVRYNDGKSTRYWPFGAVVTGNAFDYLGVPPFLGRGIKTEDENPGAPAVFVMSYRFWQREFSGDPEILGQTFVLNDIPTTLIGVMPPHFNAFNASYWLPVSSGKNGNDLRGGAAIMGRCKTGVSVRAAAADLDAIAHRLRMANPDGTTPKQFAIVSETLLHSLIGDFEKTLYALLTAVLLLLLIACGNVANLLLARASTRERETAMRATLGATRGRLIRQLLTESFLLAAAGAVLGCAFAYFGLKVVVALIPTGTLPEETVIRMNVPVLLMAIGSAMLTAILCSLAPALHVLRDDLQSRLVGGGKGAQGKFRHGQLRHGLVVVEVALSIILLIGAGLLMRSFLVLTHVDLGFDSRNVFYFRLDPTTYAQFSEMDRKVRQNALTRILLERLKALPGVVSVAESIQEPPLLYDWSDISIPGKPHTERWETRYEICSDAYFHTLGLPLIRGRFFSEDDVSAERYVMVVSQTFARRFFLGEDPIGRKVKLDVLDRPFLYAPHNTFFEIVGIVGDYKTRGPNSWETFPEAFIPYSVQAMSWRTFLVRTAADADSFGKIVDQEVRSVDPTVRIVVSGTLEGSLREFYRGPQFELAVLAAFALVGLLLVVIGIFSVMAYTVSLQTHEIGIRRALGAQQANILRWVLLNGLRLVTAGILVGLFASYALTRFLASQISGISTTDPWTFVGVIILVIPVGLVACLLPARRAASVDPLVALRYE